MKTEDKILKQFEFYFSDSNLPNDKFLRSQVANNTEGYVNLDIVASFKRVQDLSKDHKEIIEALKKSKMLEVSEDGKMVRRVTPLPETNSMLARTIYCKGLPSDSTIESVESLFKGLSVACVRLRRNKESREFKGSAFIEFTGEDEMQKALKSEITINSQKLLVVTKREYDASKLQERNEKKLKEKKLKYSKDIEDYKKRFGITGNGLFVKVTGLSKGELKGDTLKEKFTPYGEVAYVDYPVPMKDSKQDDYTICFARFKDTTGASNMVKEFQEKEIKLQENRCVATLLNEKEEDAYLVSLVVRQNEKRGQKRKNKFRGKNEKKKRE